MIIAINKKPSLGDFESLLKITTNSLNKDVVTKEDYFASRVGIKLEHDVCERMREFAKGGPFEGTIQLISGQKFPDIITNKYYGVEVKTTTQNHWKTTGNSVLESTRVDDVERIFLLFGKLAKPVEFKYRTYEDCLSEVVVTHSPRYLIDMKLNCGETIFDKISVPYDDLRQMENPISPIVEYYRTQLKEGEELWWIESGNTTDVPANSITIRLWNTLSAIEKNQIRIEALVYFPEIFGNSSKKYNRLALWLVSRHGIVPTSLRDFYTAGGRRDIVVGRVTFRKVPRIFDHIKEYSNNILSFIVVQDIVELAEKWGRKNIRENTKTQVWIDIVSEYAAQGGFNAKPLLEAVFKV